MPIPVVGQVLTALGYLQKGLEWFSETTGVTITADIWFNLYAIGELKIAATLNFSTWHVEPKVEVGLKLGVELGCRIEASMKTVVLEGEKTSSGKIGTGAELEGSAETGFSFEATGTGPLKVEGGISFLGLVLKVSGEATVFYGEKDRDRGIPIDKKFEIIEKTEIAKFDLDLKKIVAG